MRRLTRATILGGGTLFVLTGILVGSFVLSVQESGEEVHLLEEALTSVEEKVALHHREGSYTEWYGLRKGKPCSLHLTAERSEVSQSYSRAGIAQQQFFGVQGEWEEQERSCFFAADRAAMDHRFDRLEAEKVHFTTKRGENVETQGDADRLESGNGWTAKNFQGELFLAEDETMQLMTPILRLEGDVCHLESKATREVCLLFRNHRFSCRHGEWDLVSGRGDFTGGANWVWDLEEEGDPFRLQAEAFTVILADPSQVSVKGEEAVQSVEARGDVALSFDTYRIEGDVAHFEQGLVTLSRENGEEKCLLSDQSGNVFAAKRILLKQADSPWLFLEEVNGTIVAEGGESISIEAAALQYFSDSQRMMGHGPLFLRNAPWGDMDIEEQLWLQFNREGEQTVLTAVQIHGGASLFLQKEGQEVPSQLRCPGTTTVDPLAQTLRMEWDRTTKEKIEWVDGVGKVTAENLSITYERDKGILRPLSVNLRGDVAMVHPYLHLASLGHEETQYLLADEVDFSIPDEKIAFVAHEPRRVLLYNSFNNTEMSANGLIMERDPETKKFSIEGKGQVHFSLAEKEISDLRNRFHLHTPFRKDHG